MLYLSELIVLWVDGSILHGETLSYFLFHDLWNKGYGMCYPVWDGTYKITLAANWKK